MSGRVNDSFVEASSLPLYRHLSPTQAICGVRMTERPLSSTSGDTMAFMANLATSNSSDFAGLHARYLASAPLSSDSPRQSFLNATPNDSGTLLGTKNENYAEEPILTTTTAVISPKSKRRSVTIIFLLLTALILIAVAVVVPVYFTVIKPKLHVAAKSNSSGSGSGGSSSGGSGGSTPSSGSSNAITGGGGSVVHTANGTTFIYNNTFGGFCKCSTDYIVCST